MDAVLPGHVERNDHHAGLRDDHALQLARDERNALLRLEELEERRLQCASPLTGESARFQTAEGAYWRRLASAEGVRPRVLADAAVPRERTSFLREEAASPHKTMRSERG